METARERLYRLVLINPKASWSQKDLADRAGCSRGYVSRVVAVLVASGVLGRPYKNRVVLTGPTRLLTLWASRRQLPRPTFVATPRTPEEIEAVLRGFDGVALTLFRAAWHRTKFMATSSLEAYVSRARLPELVERLGTPAPEPTSVALYPTDGPELEGLEWIEGVPVVSVPQNVVDLMAVGGQGPRVALQLARAHGLLEV